MADDKSESKRTSLRRDRMLRSEHAEVPSSASSVFYNLGELSIVTISRGCRASE